VKGSEWLLHTCCEGLGRPTLRSLDFTLVNSEEPPNIFLNVVNVRSEPVFIIMTLITM